MTQGYAECYEILREHGKTFYVMAKLLGPTRGRAIAAIYGFARTSDDAVDEADASAKPEQIRTQLDGMIVELHRAIQGMSETPRYAVLGETIRKYGIAIHPFEDLIEGISMDLSKKRYANYNELQLYCYRVAGTIGLMITPVAGYRGGAKALEYAKTLGTAFQLTNILRDVGADLELDRIYLPKEDLDRYGVTESDLCMRRNDAAFRALMEYEIGRAFRLYEEGLALIPLVTSWGGRLAFQFAVDAYSEILNKIRVNDYDVYTKRAHLTLWEKIKMLPRSWLRARRAYRRGIGNQGS